MAPQLIKMNIDNIYCTDITNMCAISKKENKQKS